ncbi:MAG: peptidase associated/transthyretin-like domain-containing protein, partial [Planctomycetota bacterium]
MYSQRKRIIWKVSILGVFLLSVIESSLFGFTLTVQGPYGTPVDGYRWLVEEDTTNYTMPGVPVADSIGLDIHNSYAPVVLKGHSATSAVDVSVPSDKRYFVSVLPDASGPWSGVMGGAGVDVNQTDVTVVVHRQPTPTAQISILVFADQNPINNIVDEHEQGIGGATVILAELGGQLMMDAFGNALGTTYQRDQFGDYILDFNLNPIVESMGSGVITTLTQEDFDANNNPHNLKVGEALIKNIAPGKYGVIVNPPSMDDQGNAIEWIQTSTIEGTPTVDAWVKAKEPRLFVEGFGTGFNHCFFGFIKTAPATPSTYKGRTYPATDWVAQPPTGTGTIQGRLRLNHLARPPMTQGFFAGDIVGEGWVGLNDPLARPGVAIQQGQHAGLYAAPCNPDGTFVINNVPAGTYQLVTWDKPIDTLFGFHSVTVGDGENVNLGDVLVYRWFGTFEGSVFLDTDEDGFRDPGEPGIFEQNVNIRFRDGTVYQAQGTDVFGEYALEEVFPFFKWLVVEVDFARYKATGMTAVVDGGGQVQPDNGWV